MKRYLESMRLANPALGALLFLIINHTAQATLPSEEKKLVGTVRVAYADLDLSREADIQVLLGRIEKAAYRACGGDPRRHPSYDVMPRYTKEVFAECREDAITRAIVTIDMPMLSQARLQAASK